ncbi:MAG TPA: alkaline phosphatase family protein [Kofleriaceae bacterium]
MRGIGVLCEWLGAGLLVLASGACGDNLAAPESTPPVDCGTRVPSPPPALPPAYDQQATERVACAFGPGATTAATIGPQVPAIPPGTVEHVIVVMRENHSFDEYLSAYRPSGGQTIDVATDDNSNPDPASGGKPIHRFHDPRYCIEDANHEWSAAHLQFDNGRLDGFVASANDTHGNAGGGGRVMGYYTAEDLPFYYWLAEHFATSDRYFSSVLGPTHANLEFYYRATSCGIAEGVDTNAKLLDCGRAGPTIFDRVGPGGSYKVYSAAQPATLAAAVALGAYPITHVVGSIQDFEDDVAANRLPDLVFVEPDYGDSLATANDEHPPRDVQDGQRFAYDIVEAVMSHPDVWNHTVMFITWDENGGFYDHVVPSRACKPDGAEAPDFAFDNYGFRVPLLVVSPFARPGYVSHHVADHTSIARFVEHWKAQGAMTGRDANAWPLLDMFQFDAPTSIALPDVSLAEQSSDPVHVGTCGPGGTGVVP